jgi:transcriptional regulator with XRE-family HTH domain
MGLARRPQPRRLASKLRKIRKKMDLSQEQMAELLSSKKSAVYPGNVSEFERGKREPSLLTLLGYARVAGVTVDVLIDDGLDLAD